MKLIEVSKENAIITYKKLDVNMCSPTMGFKYKIGKVYKQDHFNTNLTRTCTYRRFYSLTRNQINNYHYSNCTRIFQCKVWGKIIKENNKIASEHILLAKEVFYFHNEYEAYLYCRDVKDIKKMWKKIKNSYVAFLYCKFVKDRKEIRNKITNNSDACAYCMCSKNKKGIEEVKSRITNSLDILNLKNLGII